MKIAVTISDATHAIHLGGEVARITHLIEIPDESMPAEVVAALIVASKPKSYVSVSTSLVVPPKEQGR